MSNPIHGNNETTHGEGILMAFNRTQVDGRRVASVGDVVPCPIHSANATTTGSTRVTQCGSLLVTTANDDVAVR